ncbi:MAG: alpha/beta hydrolase [Nitrospira sp.]|nr:alpha/beta hydrolase [Nitrospira sp.]
MTVALAVAGLAICSPATADSRGAAPPAVPELDWKECPKGSAGRAVGGFLCATVKVPFDYHDPAGKSIKLTVIMHPADDQSTRIGTLFFNPGGPGGMGTVFLPAWFTFFPATLRQRFDIVSWDPRGTGESSGVQCFASGDEEDAFLGEFANSIPIGLQQQLTYINKWTEAGERCAKRNGALLSHMSTADVARDLDLLRQAVGESALHYWGISYGTMLGATYANLFPHAVGRLVLDGNAAPEIWLAGGDKTPALPTMLRLGQDVGLQKSLDAFLTLCGQAPKENCAFTAGSARATEKKWGALLERLREGPITFPSGTIITYGRVLTIMSEGLFIVQPFANEKFSDLDVPGWGGLAVILEAVAQAGGVNSAQADAPALKQPPKRMKERYAGPEQEMAVECAETPSPRDPADYINLEPFVLQRSGPIGLPILWQDEPCATWPARALRVYEGPWNTPRANPILLIGNTGDPATPYASSVKMLEQLGYARLLTVRGNGHTALVNPSTCAYNYAVDFLLGGALPPEGTVCEQDAAPFSLPSPP